MIGRTISHYKILEKLGEGGMGVIYKAQDTQLDRPVALKFLRSGEFGAEEYKKRFIREARAAAGLSHPNICTIYEIDSAEDWIFIAMAYLDGVDLAEKLKSGPLEPIEALDIAIQVCRGLDVAHKKGIVHRDIKSANVMLTGDGQVKVMDFGLATVAGATTITKSNTAMGTVAYMSPEQTRGEEVDERSDIWSLGVCLYEMLTGDLPFTGEYDTAVSFAVLNTEPAPVSQLRPGISLELDEIIEKAMAKDLDDRYPSVARMMADLKSVREDLDPESEASASPGKTRPSIAVLPFVDMSREKDQEYFCFGMAEEIINNLVQVDSLDVVSRTSSFAFKGAQQDIRKIGQKLGVTSVLEGSVRKSGDRLRITAHLINVADGYDMWSEQYDRETKDVFVIEEEIGRSIVEALKIKLSDKEKRALEKSATKNVEAYDFYLRGRKLFYQTKRSRIRDARNMFSKAIKKDPDYALAHAGMADSYSYLYWYFDRKEENLDNAMAASQKALELDPELAEAHAARGLAVSLSKQYKEAEREFETAIRLNPMLFEAYYFFARTYFVQGKKQEAVDMFEKACEVSPDDHQAPNMLGFILKDMGRHEEGDAAYRKGLENVEKHLETNPDDSRAVYLGSSALIDLGETERGLKWSMRAVSLDPNDSYILSGIVCNYARLGEIDEAIYYFDKAVKAGFAHKAWIENDTDLDPIRNHPRYEEIMKTLQ